MARQKTKAQRLAEGVKKAVGAGKTVAVETVDFSDPDRPPTCLEVDFPILPVNQVAAIEGNAGKPIYQVSKWWARRRSSVFRSLLLSASMKAPDDPLEAAKAVWDVYYANHQKKGALSHLKVVDPFMGGGTTLVEGSRLGMDMTGVDLNPVAWFVVKTELAQVHKAAVEALLEDIEAEVKPQIMPFYACDCPRGHKGKWTKTATGEVMGDDFNPLALTPSERADYSYAGPETVYVFWAKHGPCQVTGCGHRTPVMTKPVMAIKKLSIKYWPYKCKNGQCQRAFDIEEQDARMAPGVPLVVAETERPFVVPSGEHDLSPPKKRRFDVTCPHCGHEHDAIDLPAKAPKKKKVELSLLVHPQWLAGESSVGPDGSPFGGSVTDSAEATAAWNRARASKMQLLEVRGKLPDSIVDPITGAEIKTGSDGGTVPRRSNYACGACGTVQDVLTTVKASGKTGPVAAYAVQGYCPDCDSAGEAYNGRFFAPVVCSDAFDAADREWAHRSTGELSDYWPRSELPYGFMTHHLNGGIPNHGFTHWWTMFNARQRLVQSQILRAVTKNGDHEWDVREVVLSVFQQYLRNQNMFTIWNVGGDKLEPMFANNNYHPKSTMIENGVFSRLGRGNWQSSAEGLLNALDWASDPWELASNSHLVQVSPQLEEVTSGKSEKASPGDPVRAADVVCGSATSLEWADSESVDLVITDPPFGGLLHYSELSDFFYVWLRLALKDRYPDYFTSEYVPKSLEIVENRARNPDDPGAFYQRLLTAAWAEAKRVLKPSGILAFTFHHSEDEPWVQVLESLFDAGFYLEATYPIRSDEIKGDGEFGSRKVEYDIIHVCRKRTFEPRRVSWAKMRRQILKEVRRLQGLLEHHQRGGLPSADIEVIKRGKALEYYSKHYGQVYEAEGQALTVKDAVLGVLQVLEEEATPGVEPPPVTASPFTRQLMRMFRGTSEQPLDQVQKYLRGTGISPSEFENRGWIHEDKKVYYLTPFIDVAQAWHRKHRVGLVHDYDQAAFLIGACFDGSGIKAEDTLSNANFKPHPALGSLLEWFSTHSTDPTVRVAAGRADRLYRSWQARNRSTVQQLALFADDGGDE
jgi:putative DNA methylase